MGQAARQGDMTSHGGAIVKGALRTMVGKMPAARVGDMHICPLVTPGTPPVPHAGGAIANGSTGVFIEGMPAARVGDMAICVGPPDSIALGCPTVIIGEQCASSPGSAATGAAASAHYSGGNPHSDDEENHFIDLSFEDSAGLPVGAPSYVLRYPDGSTAEGILSPQLRRTGVPQGNYEITIKAITAARWSVDTLVVGESVELTIETAGFDDGTEVAIEIMEKNGCEPDKTVAFIEQVTVSGDAASCTWNTGIVEDDDNNHAQARGFSNPQFFFTARINDLGARSGYLSLTRTLELELLDQAGNPVADEPYIVFLSNGSALRGNLDSSGNAVLDNVPLCEWRVRYPERESVEER